MCGLAGAWWLHEPHDAENRLAGAAHALTHRGPDGNDTLFRRSERGTVALGHTRLAILDLTDRGRQPMWSRCGRYALVYNGEVYNYVELREELERVGVEFRSSGDSEVLLEAWAHWGPDCLPRLTGMYAFCIYDSRGETLTLVRDPFGIKPLFFDHADGVLVFASELGALLRLRSGTPELDWQRSYDYLVHGDYDTVNQSFVRGASHLAQGTALSLDLASGQLTELPRWWRPQFRVESKLTYPQAVEAVRERFLDNIRQHLRSDVPVGAALSGGVDSSSIVCGMRHDEFSLEEIADEREANRRYLEGLRAQWPALLIADFTERLCPETRCESHAGDRLLWRDRGHLSVEGAERLVPDVQMMLERAAAQ